MKEEIKEWKAQGSPRHQPMEVDQKVVRFSTAGIHLLCSTDFHSLQKSVTIKRTSMSNIVLQATQTWITSILKPVSPCSGLRLVEAQSRVIIEEILQIFPLASTFTTNTRPILKNKKNLKEMSCRDRPKEGSKFINLIVKQTGLLRPTSESASQKFSKCSDLRGIMTELSQLSISIFIRYLLISWRYSLPSFAKWRSLALP